MEDIVNNSKPIDNSFYDVVIQEIIEWEKENTHKEKEKRNDAD